LLTTLYQQVLKKCLGLGFLRGAAVVVFVIDECALQAFFGCIPITKTTTQATPLPSLAWLAGHLLQKPRQATSQVAIIRFLGLNSIVPAIAVVVFVIDALLPELEAQKRTSPLLLRQRKYGVGLLNRSSSPVSERSGTQAETQNRTL
jgi:hypothetical protein